MSTKRGKLKIHKESIRRLAATELRRVAGGTTIDAGESGTCETQTCESNCSNCSECTGCLGCFL